MLLVGIVFLLVIVLQGHGRPECFFVLLPAIFLASVLYDSGLFASLLSTVLLYFLVLPANTAIVPVRFAPALIIFLICALGLAILSEALRTALDRASAADQMKELLLRELNHRTKNNLAMVVSVLSLEKRFTPNVEVRASLAKAMERVVAIASAHDHFQPTADVLSDDGLVIEMRGYLDRLCTHLMSALKGLRPIQIELEMREHMMPSREAITVGLIVNELVTNALKYAFPGARAGTIRIGLAQSDRLELVVEDNGIGCMGTDPGSGTKLSRLLAQQLDAEIIWEDAEPGCRVRVLGRSR
jgi:two-component sensor histidine kinase